MIPINLMDHYNKLLAHKTDVVTLTTSDLMEFVRNNVLSCTDELHEAMNETGWKPWADGDFMNRAAFLGELADAQLFLCNLMLAALAVDGTISELEYELTAKIDERIARSIRRQEDGYDGVSSKCPGCKRALEDVEVTEAIDNDCGCCVYRQCGACGHIWKATADV